MIAKCTCNMHALLTCHIRGSGRGARLEKAKEQEPHDLATYGSVTCKNSNSMAP